MSYMRVKPAVLLNKWQPIIRVEAAFSNLTNVGAIVEALQPTKLLLAEGDSWFDKFSPLFLEGTNFLDHLKTPERTVGLDIATIGDTAAQMIDDRQMEWTKLLLREFQFHAILLSAGGNDLKNVVPKRMLELTPGVNAENLSLSTRNELRRASTYDDIIEDVIGNVKSWIRAVRESVDKTGKRVHATTPIITHGYDFFQPRPAKAKIVPRLNFGLGPWLHPLLLAAGFNDAEMRSLADAIVDQLNVRLQSDIDSLDNVTLINQLGLLTPADPGTTSASEHWLDEIHPNRDGFERLARNRWDIVLAEKLEFALSPREIEGADRPTNQSTALLDVSLPVA
jgi:lysophospholipase L1-like esterase